MRSIIPGAAGTTPTNSTTYVAAPGQIGPDNGGNNFVALSQEAKAQQIFPVAGTITRFAVRSSVAPGGSGSWTYRIRKNGIDTDAFVTISGTGTSGETSEPVSVAAGDLISITLVPANAPSSSGTRRWTIEFEDTGCPLFFRAAVSTTTFAGGIFPVSGQGASVMGGSQGNIVPCAGTIKSFHARTTVAPGGSAAWLITLQVNGIATALAASISGSNTTVASSEANIAVAAGDVIRWNITKVNAPANVGDFTIGALFEPTVAGEQPIMGVAFVDFVSASVTEYGYMNGMGTWGTSEANVQGLMFERTLKNFWAALTAAPGVGNSQAVSLRVGGASVYTLTLTSTAIMSTTSDVDADDLSLIAVEHDPTGTPANSFLSWSFTSYIADAPPSNQVDTGIPLGYWWPAR